MKYTFNYYYLEKFVVVVVVFNYCTTRSVVVCHCGISFFLTTQRNGDNVGRLLGNNII